MARTRFSSVAEFLDAQTPEVRASVQSLRRLVTTADARVVEVVKWNSPSYTLDGADRLTVNVDRHGVVRLILHRGTAEVEQKGSASTFGADPSGVLTWHSDIRASMPADAEPEAAREVVRAWLAA